MNPDPAKPHSFLPSYSFLAYSSSLPAHPFRRWPLTALLSSCILVSKTDFSTTHYIHPTFPPPWPPTPASYVEVFRRFTLAGHVFNECRHRRCHVNYCPRAGQHHFEHEPTNPASLYIRPAHICGYAAVCYMRIRHILRDLIIGLRFRNNLRRHSLGYTHNRLVVYSIRRWQLCFVKNEQIARAGVYDAIGGCAENSAENM